jgi:hypothetical protein
MIVFDIICSNGHTFEGWFEDLEAYQSQKTDNFIACPICNDTDIQRRPSSFGIKTASSAQNEISPELMQHHFTKKIAEFVDKNFDDVGANFTKEALKIHYGVKKPRNIKGVSTKEEEKLLKEEGIEFFKIPVAKPEESPSDS